MLNKQSIWRWFETPWRTRDVTAIWADADKCSLLRHSNYSVVFGILNKYWCLVYLECDQHVLSPENTGIPITGCYTSIFEGIVMTAKYINLFTMTVSTFIAAPEFKTKDKICCKEKTPNSCRQGYKLYSITLLGLDLEKLLWHWQLSRKLIFVTFVIPRKNTHWKSYRGLSLMFNHHALLRANIRTMATTVWHKSPCGFHRNHDFHSICYMPMPLCMIHLNAWFLYGSFIISMLDVFTKM